MTPASRDTTRTTAATECDWCHGPLLASVRSDAIICSKRCRQAHNRWKHGVGQPPPGRADHPMRLAYADPPYPGLARRYFRNHPDFRGEVDHAKLVEHLTGFDGWAHSTSAKALQDVLALCPPGVQVGSWHRGPRPNDSGRVLSGWEPVIFSPARVALEATSTGSSSRVDTLVKGVTPRRTDPPRVIGAKPGAFCGWVFTCSARSPATSSATFSPAPAASHEPGASTPEALWQPVSRVRLSGRGC